MKRIVLRLLLLPALLLAAANTIPAGEPANAANWKTWVIPSGKDHGVPPPPDAASTHSEIEWLRSASREDQPLITGQIRFWDAGPPSYRWMDLVAKRHSNGENIGAFPRAYAYVSIAIYDATIAAFNAKQAYRRPRPSTIDPDAAIQPRVAVPANFSYPSDYAATAAAAATVLAYLVPAEAAYFHALAEEAGKSRLYAGVEYPSDYFAGLELGKRVAEQVIARARADGSDTLWTGTVPAGPCRWTGANPGNITAIYWKPFLLTSASEFRPAPPPGCDSQQTQSDLAQVRNFPRTLNLANLATNAKALYWQTPEGNYAWATMQLNRWLLENKLEQDPPRAARAHALISAVGYDAFIASQDGKYAYWYPRPAQVDPALTVLFQAPNFPSYPSNHSVLSTSRAEMLAYLFPDRAEAIRAMAKEAGDSRIWAGIHFEMDNQAGVTLGRKVAHKFIEWAENDGSPNGK